MRRFILLIIALATLLPSLALAYDVLVLQSRHDPSHDEVLKGFLASQSASQRTIVLSDYAEVDVIRIVREDHPRLILAVGDTALTLARKIQKTPVLAVMTLGIHNLKTIQPNLTGIGMFVSPERYITMFKDLKIRRVGVIHDPAKTGWYLRQARKAAQEAGIELLIREVSEPRDTLSRISGLSGKVDALWMIPDTTAVTRETIEAYFRFAQEQDIMLISFSTSYLGLGAAAVIDIDRSGLGRQAGALAAQIIGGSHLADISPALPIDTVIKTNQQVLKHLRRFQ